MLIQNWSYLILNFMVGIMFLNPAHATCQVHPSEYAYHDDSVTRAESDSANCRRYPEDYVQGGVHPEHYIHCDGTKLKLTDSNFGQETTDYYTWSAKVAEQLLIIFPTRVSLTTITLHYYSDSVRGLPRLRFYAVPDDFDVWDTPTTSYPRVEVAAVPPGGEPAGHRNVSINVNFDTKKVLMYKYTRTFVFAMSEMECFQCMQTATAEATIISTFDSASSSISSTQYTSDPETTSDFPDILDDTKMPRGQSRAAIIAIGVSTATLLILSSALIITVVVLIWRHKRRSTKHHLYTDSSHSLLSRRSGQQVQPQENLSELYNQIYLSPSAGQTEYIPKCETASIINNLSITSQNIDPTYSMTGDDIAGHSSILNAANRVTTSQLSSHKAQESTSEQPTYAAVDKTKKKFKRQRKKEDPQCKAAEKGSPITPYGHEATSPHTIEDLYTAIKKKPNVCELKGKEETPQIPPRTVEELYTTVQKKSKHTFHGDGNKDEVPSHKVDQMHAARGKPSPILQNITGDLYTEVMKKPKDGSADDTEAAPPIPPHTVEELYTADI